MDFERAKRREALLDARYTGSFITGDLEVGIIKRYLSTRLVEQPEKSLWRYLTSHNGKISMTNANVGVNTTKQFGKDIATALSLPNAHRYTGHWSRTTAVNILIQNGATIEQTMMVTGKF